MAKITKLEKEMEKILPEDLISEIIVKLPVKSLLRCKCVCKAWYDLIKSPNFIDKHLKYSTTKTDQILFIHSHRKWTQLLSVHDYESLEFIDVQFMKIPRLDYHALEISGPCNGLLCLLDIQSELVLYNPAIREYKYLPRPLPSHYVLGFGFGFVSNPNDHKVVSFVSFKNELSEDDTENISDEDNAEDDDENSAGNDDDSESDEEYIGDNIVKGNHDNEDGEDSNSDDDDEPKIKLQVYNLSTNSWREIKCDCPDSIGDDQYGILFNGVLHWTAYRKGKEIIIGFDLSTEVLHDIELPSDLMGKFGISKSLMVLNNCLALFAFTYTNYTTPEEDFIDIWVMKDYGVAESWTKQVSAGPLSCMYRPLMLWKNKTILLESIYGTMISWDLDTMEINESVMHAVEGLKGVMVYQESLISLV